MMTMRELYDLLRKIKEITGEDVPIMLEIPNGDGDTTEMPLHDWYIRTDSVVLRP